MGCKGTFVDVIERVKEEEELVRQSNAVMMPANSIVISDLDGRIIDVNEATLKMYGLDEKKDLIDKNSFKLATAVQPEKALQGMSEVLERGCVKDREYHVITRGGRQITTNAMTAIMKDAYGKPVGFVTVSRDTTEKKKMQEQLIITDRLASIGELASGIAHELNNPLTSVIGFSDLLLERDLPNDIKEDLEVINREARRTAQIVRNVLAFARKHPEKGELVDINSVIQKVLEMRTYEESINNIQVKTRFAPHLPQVMVNGFELQRVFLNIIINDEYFMIEAHRKGTLTITTERQGDTARASFTDDGPGIAEENLTHIFDPFFTTKEVGKGTGLGLSICHGIVKAYGGRIYAESELGKGTTFVVELPLNKE